MPSSPAPHRALEGPASRAVRAPGGSDPQQGPTGATEPARSNVQQTLLPSPGGLRAHGALPSPQGGAHCTRGPRSRAADSGLRAAAPATVFSRHAPPPTARPGKKYTIVLLPWAARLGWGLASAPVATPWGSPVVPPCSTTGAGDSSPTRWGRSANLAGTRMEGASPGLRWPESSRKCHRGPTGCPGKGWCAAGRAPNIKRGGRRSSCHGAPGRTRRPGAFLCAAE